MQPFLFGFVPENAPRQKKKKKSLPCAKGGVAAFAVTEGLFKLNCRFEDYQK